MDEAEPLQLTYSSCQETSRSIGKLALALSKAQGAMKPAAMDAKNPHFGNRYATLDSIIEAVRKPLADNELAVIQRTANGDGHIRLITTLAHSSGEWIESTLTLILTSVGRPGDAITMQSLGSALTYARRYSLAAITGAVSDADDDGNAAGETKTPTKKPDLKSTDATIRGSIHTCPIHKVPFKRFEKEGKAWYAHKDGEKWCNEDKAKPKAALDSLSGIDEELLHTAVNALTPEQHARLKAQLSEAAKKEPEGPAFEDLESASVPQEAAGAPERAARAPQAPEAGNAAPTVQELVEMANSLGWSSQILTNRMRSNFKHLGDLGTFTPEQRARTAEMMRKLLAKKQAEAEVV